MIQAEKIQSNWERHLRIIDTYITGERKEKVKAMLNSFEEVYIMAPASGKSWYHNAFPGGYVDHVNRVVKMALQQKQAYEQEGGLIDFTDEELVFSALFHDLGKMGDVDKPYYLPQTDKWRQDKLQEIYSNNSELEYMLVQDRSLFLLQKFGIQANQKEYLAIRTHDGVYDDANKAYFFSRHQSSRMKTNIVHILHTADYLASKIEYDLWVSNGGSAEPKVKKTENSQGKQVKSSQGLANLLKNI